MDPQTAFLLFGTSQPVLPGTRLNAGELSCLLSEGELRDVRWGNVEVARGISYLLRDKDWGTVPASVSDIAIATDSQQFSVEFDLRMPTASATLSCRARIVGQAAGVLRFEVVATPDAVIETNRCGFVVLHPASAAGQALRVDHTGGTFSETTFPREISPSQPVFDIRGLHYEAVLGVEVSFGLEAELPGDPAGKFEMEDQRNWSDASFKTYVASLLDPWPYALPAGKPLRQSVEMHVRGSPGAGTPLDQSPPIVISGPIQIRMPAIGVGVPRGIAQARPAETAALCGLGAGWWIVEADLADSQLEADLRTVARLRSASTQVQIDVISQRGESPHYSAELIAAICRRAELKVDAVRLLPPEYLKSFQPSEKWPSLPPLEEFSAAARQSFPGAKVGGGMFTYFTELNRKRPSGAGLSFIGHSTCPIVHAPDDEAVMQTLEALPHIARSTAKHWPNVPYRLGPSSIAMRRNPYGDAPATNADRQRVAMAQIDPRHSGRFGAAWTAAYAAAVVPEGLEVLALHDSHGASGPFGTPLEEPLAKVDVVPAWKTLEQLAQGAGARLMPIENLPEGIAGVAWEASPSSGRGLISNTTLRQQRIEFALPVAAGGRTAQELDLEAYEVVAFAFSLPLHDGPV